VSGLTPAIVVAAGAAGVAAASAVRLVARPPGRLGPRLRPFAQLSRSRLGAGDADPAVLWDRPRTAAVEVLAPPVRRAAAALARLIDAGDRAGVEARVRHAGLAASADDYRMRQLGWSAGGAAMGAAVGIGIGLSAATTLVLVALLAYAGATRWRARVDRAIAARRGLMRAELATVCQLLAVHVRTGHGPVEAVRSVAARSRGPVGGELGDAVGLIAGGLAPAVAYERLAAACAEPLAARLYRMLGPATAAGADVATALLALADDVRAERRDEIARAAVRRRAAMLVPLLGLIAPTMLLFIAAALPHVVFGS